MGVGWTEFGEVVVAEGLKFRLRFAGEDGGGEGESVLAGIGGGVALALEGSGSAGEASVGARGGYAGG